MLEWQPIIETGIKALGPKIIDSALSASQKSFKERSPYTKLSFDLHFQNSYARCTKIKTIVNGDNPINLLENYVNPDFKFKHETIDEYKFIDSIFENKHVSLVGSAGSGKSMFMRYFWICCSVEPRGKIPIYIELRKYNEITYDDFMTYVYHVSTDNQDSENRLLFDRAVKEGQFVFILDGFDEVKSAKRESCEGGILKLSETNNVVIVSGRPDETYHSWQMFCLYEMMPLNIAQTTKLIENIDFDKTVKRKFLTRLKNGLYTDHQSFASRPLLATMMLLTFSSFADIPEKIHVFYDQAFDTLFSRHDATKEAFKRERKTDHSIDVFKRLFSLFCLLTYNDAANDFSEGSILETLRTVEKLESISLKPDLFLADLIDAVCLLQKDGLKYVFSHRSFQEYFTAYSLVRLPEDKVGELLKRFSSRTADSVIPMLFDMNSSLVERSYLSNALKEYVSATSAIKGSFRLLEYLELIGAAILIQYMPSVTRGNTVLVFIVGNDNQHNVVRELTLRLYPPSVIPEHVGHVREIDPYLPLADVKEFETSFLPLVSPTFTDKHGTMIYQSNRLSLNRRTKKSRPSKIEVVNITSPDRLAALHKWLEGSTWLRYIEFDHNLIIKISDKVGLDINKKEKTMEEILGLGAASGS